MIKVRNIVIEGNKIGRTIDFRTANITCDLLDQDFTGTWMSKTEFDGEIYPSISSIILSMGGKALIETHLFNFNKDIYGKEIEVELIYKARGEKKFKNKEEVKNQIKSDILSAKIYHGIMKSCTNCALCYYQDHGYSNWTVEGTTTECHLDLNPGFPAESSYWDNDDAYNKAISYAEECAMYIEGDQDHYDVDGETERMSNEELQKLIREGKINKILK